MDGIMLNFEAYCKDFNAVKDTVLEKLYKDKIISKGQFETYCYKWNIVIIKKSWFVSWAEKFFPKNKDENASDYVFKYVRFEE